MKCINTQLFIAKTSNAVFASGLALMLTLGISSARADETCSSPYLARIEGQEEFVYVWTLGVEGLGDGSDKLVTVGVKPGSSNYGKVISATSVGGRAPALAGRARKQPRVYFRCAH
jgi:selenium-binding protein 1